MNKLFVGAAILTAVGIGGMNAELISANEIDTQPNLEETEEYIEETYQNQETIEKDIPEISENDDLQQKTEDLKDMEIEPDLPDFETATPVEEEIKQAESKNEQETIEEDMQAEPSKSMEESEAVEAQLFTERISQKTLSGVDISHWQAGINIGNLDADFVICKATGGNQYIDPSFNVYAQNILNSNKLLGFYHFAQEASCPGTAEEEAGHFYNTVQNYIGKGIPVLDWEADALRKGPAWAKLFLDTFYNLSGVKCLIYMSAYNTRVYDWTDVADSGYKLWLAQYPNNDPVYGHDKEPWRDDKGVGAFKEPVVHQYTSTGYISGYGGNLDLDIFYGDANTWNNLAKVENVPTQFEMYRVYNPNSGEHFYTKNINERNYLVSLGWHNEGIGWLAPRTGNSVYRLYNPNAGDHHYTLDASERDTLIRAGWSYEGIGWCSDLSNAVPLYRSYNPNAKAGAHHYTINKSEHDYLIRLGWRDEGIAWYGVSKTRKSTATGVASMFSSGFSVENNQTNSEQIIPEDLLVAKKLNYKVHLPVIQKIKVEIPSEKDQWIFNKNKILKEI